MEKCGKVVKSGEKWGEVAKSMKSWKKWLKCRKVLKSGEKWGKVGKSWKKWGKVEKVGKAGQKWRKLAILDDQKSLLIAFQIITELLFFDFFFKMAAGRHF